MTEITLDTVLQAIAELRTGLEGRLEQLERGQTKLRVDLSERIDRLQDGVTALRQGYIVDWANVERTSLVARGAADETRALGVQVSELTKLVHILEAQIRDLRGDG